MSNTFEGAEVVPALHRQENRQAKEILADSRKALREILTPPEQVADKMRDRISGVIKDVLRSDPNPELQRVMQTTAGICLWEHMALDTGQSLPEGLVFTPMDHDRKFVKISFDKNKLSRREYDYAMAIFESRGVSQDFAEWEKEFQDERREELATAIEASIRQSPLIDFFNSFGVSQQQKTEPQELKPQDEMMVKATLEGAFAHKYAHLLRGQSREKAQSLYQGVMSAYSYEVEQALLREKAARSFTPEEEVRLRRELVEQFDRKWHGFSGGVSRENVPLQYIASFSEALRDAYTHEVQEQLTDTAAEQKDTKRQQLEAAFRKKWADQINGIFGTISFANEEAKNAYHTLRATYDQEVTRPLYVATIPKPQVPNQETNKEDIVRNGFTTFLAPNYYADADYHLGDEGKPTKDEFVRALTVENGKFMLHFKPGEWRYWDLQEERYASGKRDLKEEAIQWDNYFTLACINPLNSDPTWYNSHFAIKALALIGPHLYDRNDKRDSQTIIEAGISEAAQKLAADIIDEKYQTLTQSRGIEDLYNAKARVVWLTHVIGPSASPSTVEDDMYDSSYGISHSRIILHNEREIRRQQQELTGRVREVTPAVLTGQKRLIHKASVDARLPKEPAEAPDLVIDCVGDTLVRSPKRLANDEDGFWDYDPRIDGMSLIARDGNRYYFKIDPEDKTRQRVDVQIPYINRLLIRDFCLQAHMRPLAEKIDERETLTISELVDLIRQHTKEYIPGMPREDGRVVITDYDGKGWTTDDQGNLLGQSQTFQKFLSDVLNRIYDKKNIKSIAGYGLQGNQIDGQYFYQTQLQVPEEGIDALLDISPLPQPIKQQPHQEDTPDTPDDDKELHPENNLVSVDTADKFEGDRKHLIATIEFAEPLIFTTASQRLITKRRRNPTIPQVPVLPGDEAVLRLKCLDNTVTDARHEPHIEGLKLIGRNDKEGTYDFAIDKKSTVYDPYFKEIPKSRRVAAAAACYRMGMKDLAKDLMATTSKKSFTVEDLRQTARKYVKYWIPREDGKPPFQVESLQDLATNGLVDEQCMLRGQCDTFEFFMRTLLHITDRKARLGTRIGYSLRYSHSIDAQLHAQTEYDRHLIDIDPNPSRSQIEVKWSDPEPAPMERNFYTDQALANWIGEQLGDWGTAAEESQARTQNQNAEIKPQTKTAVVEQLKTKQTEETIDVETPQPDEKQENEGKNDATRAVSGEEVNPESTAENSAPNTEEDEQKIQVTIPIPEQIDEEAIRLFEQEKVFREFEASTNLFTRQLASYTGIPMDIIHVEQARNDILHYFGSEIRQHTWEDIMTIPHLQIWRLVDHYDQWKQTQTDTYYDSQGKYTHRDPSEKKPFALPETLDLEKIKKWLSIYKENSQQLQEMIRKGRLPKYDQTFLTTMDNVVTHFEDWYRVPTEDTLVAA